MKIRKLAVTLFGVAALLASSTVAADAATSQPGVRRAPAQAAAPGDPHALDVAQTFRNQATGQYLTIGFVSGIGYVITTDNGAASWYVHVFKDGTRRFQNVYQLKCMEAVGNSVWPTDSPYGCDSSQEQSFYIKRWNDGTIEIKSQRYGNCLDDDGHDIVALKPCNASREQSWY